MYTQRFPAGQEPRVVIDRIGGELSVTVWDQDSIEIQAEDQPRGLQQDGDRLLIGSYDSDLQLKVPANCALSAEELHSDVSIAGLRVVELRSVHSDLDIRDISDSVELHTVHSDVRVARTPLLRISNRCDSDLEIDTVEIIEVERCEGDVKLVNVVRASIGSTGGDFDARTIGDELRVGNVGGDAAIHDCAASQLSISTVGGDLEVGVARQLSAGTIGGDAELENVSGDVELSTCGGDLDLSAGGDAEIGNVGGDLRLVAAFSAESAIRANIGGDATIELPADANLTLRAVAGGTIRGRGVDSQTQIAEIVYGSGTARCELHVGGDLRIVGAGEGGTVKSFGFDFDREFGREMGNFGREFGREMGDLGREFGREMGDLGRELGRLGSEIGREVSEALRNAGRESRGRAHRQSPHVEVYIDPERMAQIKEQARRAAAEGVSGAMEAVERAMQKMRQPAAPAAPIDVAPPLPPASPAPPAPAADVVPNTGQTIRIDQAATSSRDDDRIAILRLVAEGRITPEEGDLMLEALNN